MVHYIFGFKFGIKASRNDPIDRHDEVKSTANVKTNTKTLMNIPPADDILEFSYPPESPFDDVQLDETNFGP